MRRQHFGLRLLSTVLLVAATGCQPQQPFYFSHKAPNPAHYVNTATEIEYPDVETASLDEVTGAKPPLTLSSDRPDQTWDLKLEEAVRISLANATVIRNSLIGDVGSYRVPDAIQRAPFQVVTIYNPAQEETNPRTGVEAALSAFDAQFATSVFWERNDSPQNASFIRPQVFQQDLGTFQAQISKLNATGAQMAVRHNVRYEWNNTPSFIRPMPSEWNANLEVEIRQPFLRGYGVGYNRIAGPGAVPGFYNGVMIARLRTDQSLADFEAAVRNHVADVERAYWSLYYAYRRLDAAIAGRDAALQTWRSVYAKFQAGAKGGSAQEEAQARQQYFTFRAAVEQSHSALYEQESVLRYMMGLTSSDGRVIRPSDEPTTAEVKFDWYDAHSEALVRSPELRRQKWVIKQRELELIASKNWLLPQLDGVARYRWPGLGDELVGEHNSAYRSMVGGDFEEWHLGLDLRFPFGFRREMAGVRNAQINLIRERKVLQEQELELTHQLAEAFRDLAQNYQLAQTFYNQRVAAQTEVKAVEAAYQLGSVTLDLLLDAQRRLADAEDRYYQSLARYSIAIAGVHFRKGSLLEYNGVYLAEGPWPAKAYFDAARRAKQRDAGHYLNYGFTMPKLVSRGPYNQQAGATELPEQEGVPTTAVPATSRPGDSPSHDAGSVPMPPSAPSSPPPAPKASGVTPLPPAPRANESEPPQPSPSDTKPGPQARIMRQPLSGGPRDQPVPSQRVLSKYDLATKDLSALAGTSDQVVPAAGQWTAAQGVKADAAAYQTKTGQTPEVRPTSHAESMPEGGWKKPSR
jgi:outer membrane protein TolC